MKLIILNLTYVQYVINIMPMDYQLFILILSYNYQQINCNIRYFMKMELLLVDVYLQTRIMNHQHFQNLMDLSLINVKYFLQNIYCISSQHHFLMNQIIMDMLSHIMKIIIMFYLNYLSYSSNIHQHLISLILIIQHYHFQIFQQINFMHIIYNVIFQLDYYEVNIKLLLYFQDLMFLHMSLLNVVLLLTYLLYFLMFQILIMVNQILCIQNQQIFQH